MIAVLETFFDWVMRTVERVAVRLFGNEVEG